MEPPFDVPLNIQLCRSRCQHANSSLFIVSSCCCFFLKLVGHQSQNDCVLDPPYVVTESTSLSNLEEEKDSVTMRCMSESNPPAKVWWEKEGVNGIFSPDREITISPVTRNTAGTYKCIAQNALGMSEPAFVELNVKCKSS